MALTMVAIDVGASRTRVRLGRRPEAFHDGSEPIVRDIGSATELMELLEEIRSSLPDNERVHLSGGVAAPALGASERIMTNWPEDGRISTDAIRALGFERVQLMNDLEAAAHGLVALLDDEVQEGQIVSFGGGELPDTGHRALVIPGSGLGSAGIVDLGKGRDPRWKIIPAEVGHAMASWGERDELLRRVQEHLGRTPTWEDCVSGPGLETLWTAGGGYVDDPISAPEIALLASQGNERAQDALHHYYLFAARFSQVLALSFLCTGGLYLAGGSTRSNAPLIPEDGFLRAFRDNPRMREVLEDIPVFLVLTEINLLGPWRLGWRRL